VLKKVHEGIGMHDGMVLIQHIWGMRMAEGDDMAKHINRFREIGNQLRSLSEDGEGNGGCRADNSTHTKPSRIL